MKSFVKFRSKQSRRRQARLISPWYAALERLEDRTLLAAPTVSNPIDDQTANFGTPFEFTIPSNTFADADGASTLTFTASGLPSWLTFTAATKTFTGTPLATDAGTSNITVTVSDGTDTANDTFALSVANAVPSFSKGANQTALEDSVAKTVANWATNISQGLNESGQTVEFLVSTDNPGLFSDAPVISPTGTLTYTPAANANGSSTVTVFIRDNGGTTNGGVETSAAQTFTITITAVNDAPSFALPVSPNQIVARNSAAQTVTSFATGISAGPADESSQILNFIVTSTSPALFSVPPTVAANGTLTYTPAVNVTGIAMVSVQIHDNGGTTNGGMDTSAIQTFTITIGNGPLPVAPNGNAVYTARGTAKVRAFVVNGLLTVQINGIPYPTYLPSSVTSLTINGGSKNDEIDLSGLDPAIYNGGLVSVKINGGAGNDRMIGSFAMDSIDGGAGNDTLGGGENNDTLIGNAGTDLLAETATVDDLVLNDTLLTGLGMDRLVTIETASLTADDGGSVIDASAFTRGAVTLIGGAGEDVLTGGSKNDSITGRDGNDELSGGAGNDTILGGFGEDTLKGGLGSDLLIGGFDVDDIDGEGGRDTIVGGNGGAARGGDGTNDGDTIAPDAAAANVISEAFKKLFAFE